MTDLQLAVSLVGAGGTPHEILADPEFLAPYFSVLKSDLRVLESYRWRTGPTVRCPVFAIAGQQDPYAPPDAVNDWSRYMGGAFECRVYPGGHFYFRSQLTTFLTDLRTFLTQCEARVCAPSGCA
jgi:surfactin synthase thioesterase subunit